MDGERLVGGLDELDVVASRMGLAYGDGEPSASALIDRNLLIGLVARAAAEFLRYRRGTTTRSRMIYKRAELWIYTTYNGKGPPPGSFEWCCEWLGEDPQDCRSRLLGMTIRDLPKVDHFSSKRKRGHDDPAG